MTTAIYTRQSIDKKDSVSIEAQIEYCKRFIDTDYEIYTDKGFSGKNTDRPNFLRLKKDISDGKIKKVIAYRLDRISRNIKDFADLIEFFENNEVSFASATEQFDTSTPIGRALIYIIMTFAQLERETIAKRITDAYYFRAKQGLFTGGNCPIGYTHQIKLLNGKKMSVLKIDSSIQKHIESIFQMYAEGYSLYKIVTYFNKNKFLNKPIHSTTIKRILDNPAYTFNTPKMYEYLKSQGYNMYNSVDEWDSTKGILIFGKETGRGKTRVIIPKNKQLVTIGNFIPFIDDNLWLVCQSIKSNNKANKRLGTGSLSFLTGKLECAECGYSFGAKTTSKAGKVYKHFHCRGRSNLGNCKNSLFIPVDDLEKDFINQLNKKIKHIDFSSIKSNEGKAQNSKEYIEIIKINEEIENLISSLATGNTTVNKYINDRIEILDKHKKELEKEINASTLFQIQEDTIVTEIKNKIELVQNNIFSNLSQAEQKSILNILVDKIKSAKNGDITILWNV